jgi:hypothetical protein
VLREELDRFPGSEVGFQTQRPEGLRMMPCWPEKRKARELRAIDCDRPRRERLP